MVLAAVVLVLVVGRWKLRRRWMEVVVAVVMLWYCVVNFSGWRGVFAEPVA